MTALCKKLAKKVPRFFEKMCTDFVNINRGKNPNIFDLKKKSSKTAKWESSLARNRLFLEKNHEKNYEDIIFQEFFCKFQIKNIK